MNFTERLLLAMQCGSLLLCVASVSAQELKCPKTLAWKDATHLQRTLYKGNLSEKADWRLFSDASLFELAVDANVSKFLRHVSGLHFTYGNGRPHPDAFKEIEGAVASPMWESGTANLRPFPTPCTLKNGENLPFNERDFTYWKQGDERLQIMIFGSLKRQNFLVKYGLEIKRGGNDGQLDKLYGLWEYQAKLAALPEDFDLQGWHVFKDGDYLKTISVGRVYRLSEVLADLKP